FGDVAAGQHTGTVIGIEDALAALQPIGPLIVVGHGAVRYVEGIDRRDSNLANDGNHGLRYNEEGATEGFERGIRSESIQRGGNVLLMLPPVVGQSARGLNSVEQGFR